MRLKVKLEPWRWLILTGMGCGPIACWGDNLSRPCDQPTELGGNWLRCEDGTLHRTAAGSCPNLLPTTPPEPLSDLDTCESDADCTEQPLGYCSTVSGFPSGNHCSYGCLTDADCASGLVCVCGEPLGSCVSASCTSDLECGLGYRCADYVQHPGCGGLAFACETSQDECVTDADCQGDRQCSYQGGRHACLPASCIVGRPFLVQGEERQADLIASSAWCHGEAEAAADRPSANSSGLTIPEAAAIAERWQRVGLMEHASIAAFARFCLELLALGAPLELLEGAQQAIADETRHAHLCFSLARKYSGQAMGPGRLSLSHALGASDLRGSLLTAVLEGCVGETVAAIEAAEAAEHCDSAALRVLLRGIADDERRHAELAWRFVAWALDGAPDELIAEVETLFHQHTYQALPTSAEQGPSQLEQTLLRYGHLPETHRATLRQQVLAKVVAPAAKALVSKVRGSQPASHLSPTSVDTSSA